MPQTLIDPEKPSSGKTQTDLRNLNYDYDYPGGLDMRPGYELHDKVRDLIIEKATGSSQEIKKRFEGWREIDRKLTSFIPIDSRKLKGEKNADIKNEDERKPVQIVIPVSYAVLDTLMTYLVAAFLEEPYFRYEGVGPEDMLGAILLEMAIAYQCRRSKIGLELHTMWRNGIAYGIAPAYIGWETILGQRTVREQQTVFSRVRNAFRRTGEVEESVEDFTIYDGSTLTALDPYMCLPDPNTPIHDVQRSESFGWIEDTNLMSFMSAEKGNEYLFNAKYCKHIWGQSQFNTRHQTGRGDKRGTESRRHDMARPLDVIHYFIRVIPEDIGLGDGEYPEWWLFGLAGDNVVVQAQQLGLDHGQLPVTVAAPDYDGHSMSPISRLEMTYGLQEVIDWLFNSHMANVRKAINDMIVVDPFIVNYHDVANPGPGKLIRLRRQAWGRGVKDAVMQLQVSDVTRGHIQDSAYITDILKFVTGAQDAISGIRRNTSERVSATEASNVRTSALSRLEKAAKVMSLQAHYDIAYQMAWNTRQLMEDETYVKIIGDWEQVLREELKPEGYEQGRMRVRPSDLDINFDVIPHDGSIPSNGNPDLWLRMFQVITQNPLLARHFDVVRMFKYGAKLAGAKNLNDFVRKNVMSDEEVMKQLQAGNILPAEQAAQEGMI